MIKREIQIYTSIEQGRELFKRGLHPETGDAVYDKNSASKEYELVLLSTPICYINSDERVPCWSATRLMDLLPKKLILFNNSYYYVPMLSRYYGNPEKYICKYDNGKMGQWFIEEEPVTAVYKMMLWVLENGYIEKTEKFVGWGNYVHKVICNPEEFKLGINNYKDNYNDEYGEDD